MPALRSHLSEGLNSPQLFSSDEVICGIPWYFSHSSPSSLSSASLLSQFHLCMSGWHPCILRRPRIPASTVYTFPSFPLVQLTGAYWVWFLMLGDGKLLYSQKDVFKELTSLFCSYVPKFSFSEDLIQKTYEKAIILDFWSLGPWLCLLPEPYSSRTQPSNFQILSYSLSSYPKTCITYPFLQKHCSMYTAES